MKFRLLDCVILDRDLPEHGLRCGDLGTIVELYDPDGIEVEFLAASGDTVAVLTLTTQDVRSSSSADVVAVRSRT